MSKAEKDRKKPDTKQQISRHFLQGTIKEIAEMKTEVKTEVKAKSTSRSESEYWNSA